MIKVAMWIGRAVLVAIGVIIVYRFWLWWIPDPPETYLRTDLVNAQEADTFVTGFAMVSLVRFDTGDRLEPFSFIDTPANRGRVKGFCYRLYELAIGYESLWATVKNAEASSATDFAVDPPRVLAANIVEARQGGDRTSQAECDRINLVTPSRTNEQRLAGLRKELVDNGQWDGHVRHARNVVTTFSETIAKRRQEVLEARLRRIEQAENSLLAVSTPAEFNEWLKRTRDSLGLSPTETGEGERAGFRKTTGIEALDEATSLDDTEAAELAGRGDGRSVVEEVQETIGSALGEESSGMRLALADAGGFLGTLKLTFSTIGIFTQEKRRWLFWKDGQFYIRQDFADATYGSDFTLDLAKTRSGLFGPRRLEITVPEPYLLALDRYTTTLVAQPSDFRIQIDDDTGDTIEQALRDDLQRQIRRLEPQAVRFSKALLTSQIQQLVQADVDEIRVRFAERDMATPGELAELVRFIRETGSEADP